MKTNTLAAVYFLLCAAAVCALFDWTAKGPLLFMALALFSAVGVLLRFTPAYYVGQMICIFIYIVCFGILMVGWEPFLSPLLMYEETYFPTWVTGAVVLSVVGATAFASGTLAKYKPQGAAS